MGAGNTWMDGGSFGQGLGNGLVGAGTGAAFGAVTGGLISGTSSAIQGRNFWTGASKPIPTLDPLSPKGPSHLGTSDSKLPSKLDPVKSNQLMQNADDPLNANGMRIGQGDFAGKYDFRNFNRSGFRHNLIQLSGQNPGSSAHAHHIFPVKFQAHFNAAGINIHNPAYGVWWTATSHLQNAAAYNNAWQQFFRVNPSASQQQIFNFAKQLMQGYGF